MAEESHDHGAVNEEEDERSVEIVWGAADQLQDELGYSGIDAAHNLIAGGLELLMASCCQEHLIENLEVVASEVERRKNGDVEIH